MFKQASLGRKILLVVLPLVLLTLAILFVRHLVKTEVPRLFQAFKESSKSDRKLPEQLRQGHVEVGGDSMKKTLFFEESELVTITDIHQQRNAGGLTERLILAGTTGATFTTPNGQKKSRIRFEKKTQATTVFRSSRTGEIFFVNRGGRGWQDAGLLDSNGEILWTYGGFPGVDDMCVGDADNDGRPEFAVGFNGDGGVHLVDAQGQQQWQIEGGNEWHVEMVDADGDGQLEILYPGSSLFLVDRDGKNIREVASGYLSFNFSVCDDPANKGRKLIVVTDYHDNISLLGFDGKKLNTFSAPGSSDSFGPIRSVWLSWKAGEKPCFAALADYPFDDRAILFIFDGTGKEIYREILPEKSEAIAVTDPDGSGKVALLVGCGSKIFRYEPK